MYKRSVMRRLMVLIAGLIFFGFGIAMTTRSGLGTSPISSLPYVMSLVLPLSFGVATLVMNIFLVAGQMLMYGRNFRKRQLLQLLLVSLLGVSIDIGMYITGFFEPESYLVKVLELATGCVLIAVGVAMEVVADVVYLPGEGFVKAFSDIYSYDFGFIKISFDSALVFLTLIFSLLMLNEISGIREGTLVGALFVGWFVRILLGQMRFLRKWFIVIRN